MVNQLLWELGAWLLGWALFVGGVALLAWAYRGGAPAVEHDDDLLRDVEVSAEPLPYRRESR